MDSLNCRCFSPLYLHNPSPEESGAMTASLNGLDLLQLSGLAVT